MDINYWPVRHPHDEELFNLDTAREARQAGAYGAAIAAAGLTAERTAVVEKVGLRSLAIQDLLDTTRAARKNGDMINAVNAIASAASHITIIIHSVETGRKDGRISSDNAKTVIIRAKELQHRMVQLAKTLCHVATSQNGKQIAHAIVKRYKSPGRSGVKHNRRPSKNIITALAAE